jgi:biopolymer transport protein ExbD
MGVSFDRDNSAGFFGKQGMLTEINITPLVDVMMVLLIILMVAAPFAVSGVDVRLPSSKAKTMALTGDPVVLSVTPSGQYFLGKSSVSSKDLVEKLKAAKGSEKDPGFYIRADRAVPYGKVMEAMAAAQRAGFSRIGMLGEASVSGGKSP